MVVDGEVLISKSELNNNVNGAEVRSISIELEACEYVCHLHVLPDACMMLVRQLWMKPRTQMNVNFVVGD